MPIIKLGAVVTKHIPGCCVAMGVPARVKKEHGRDIQKLCLDVCFLPCKNESIYTKQLLI